MRISDWSSDVCSSDLRAAGITLQSQGVTIGDLYEMRTLIEPPAARLVAERNSEKAVPILRAMIEDELKKIKDRFGIKIGRASCRERMCQYVSISVVAG